MAQQALRAHVHVAVAVVLGVAGLAFAADVFSDLGITQERARDSIFEAFTRGSVPIVGTAKVFTSAAPDRRVLFVQGVTGLAKIYAQSADFKKRYAEYREVNKPKSPAPEQPVDDALADQRRATEEQVKQLRELLQQLPPDQGREMQEQIEELRATLGEMTKDPDYRKGIADALKAEQESKMASYKEALKRWEQDFPPDPNALIAKRLREFLTLTEDIDFAATLVSKDGMMRFADASLEQQPSDWKFCFRAGKEATGAARAFATAWLKELGAGRE